MNRFAIFSVLATFYISNAFAQEDAERELVSEIKEATVYSYTSDDEIYLKVFKIGDVYLYKMRDVPSRLNYYVVEDDSDDSDCPLFPIAQYATIVTEDSITIKWLGLTVTLILHTDDKTFEFYEKLFPHENFSRGFTDVNVNVHIDSQQLEGGAVIKAKQVEDGEWSFAILQGDTPRIIFPENCVKMSRKENFDTNVSITVVRKPLESININIDFDTFIDANVLYLFLRQLGTLQYD